MHYCVFDEREIKMTIETAPIAMAYKTHPKNIKHTQIFAKLTYFSFNPPRNQHINDISRFIHSVNQSISMFLPYLNHYRVITQCEINKSEDLNIWNVYTQY